MPTHTPYTLPHLQQSLTHSFNAHILTIRKQSTLHTSMQSLHVYAITTRIRNHYTCTHIPHIQTSHVCTWCVCLRHHTYTQHTHIHIHCTRVCKQYHTTLHTRTHTHTYTLTTHVSVYARDIMHTHYTHYITMCMRAHTHTHTHTHTDNHYTHQQILH